MGLKSGYKQSEAGVIPNQWEAKPLRLVLLNARLGGNYPNQSSESEFPLMKMGNLARGHFDLTKIEYVAPGVEPEGQHRLVRGDVLFNTRNTLDLVGKVAMWRDELPVAYYNSNLMRLEFDTNEVASNEYANYALNAAGSVSRLRGLATGTTSVAAIYTRDLLALPFVLPPKAEQCAIAAALRDVDTLLTELDRLIAKKRDLKQAAMQQLLTGNTRLPGFRGEWELKRLDELGAWKGGMTPSMQNPEYWHGGTVPWVSSGDIKSNLLRKTGFAVTTFAVNQGATTMIPAESILLVTRSGILRRFLPVAMTVFPVTINQDIKALIPSETMNPNFLLHALIASGDLILKKCVKTGTTVESIDFGWLKSFTILIPHLDEQTAIATALSDMDAEIESLEGRRAKTYELKQAMMQELLTGRTRLV